MSPTNPAQKHESLLLGFLNLLQAERILAPRTRVAYLNDLRHFVRFVDAGNWVVNWTRTIRRYESFCRAKKIDSRTRDRRVYVARRFAEFCTKTETGVRDWDFIRSQKASLRGEWELSDLPLETMTDLESAIEAFLYEIGRLRSKNTLKAYTNDLGGFQRFLQGLTVKAVTSDRIHEYLDGIRSCGLKESSVRRIAAAIQSFCTWCVTQGLLDEDPSGDMHAQSTARDQPGDEIPIEDVVNVINAKKSHSWFPERDHLITDLLGRYAMRPSEIVGLNCADVDGDGRVIRVGQLRLIEMHEATADLLSRYLPARNALVFSSPALIINSRGSRLTTRSLGRIVKEYAIYLGLPEDTHPMLLRKSSVMAAARSGTEMELTMRRVDSFSTNVIDLYDKAGHS